MKQTMLCQKVAGSLRPSGEESYETFDRLPTGKLIEVEVRTSRNPQHLAKYWAICQAVADAYDGFDDRDDADHWVRIQIPWMRSEYRADFGGEERLVIRTKSISMSAMDQQTFNKFYDRAMELFAELIHMDPEDLGREVHRRAELGRRA